MFESKNLLADALAAAIRDRLSSAVYYALNYTVGYVAHLDDPEEPEVEVAQEKLLEEWRELGAYTVGCIVVLSTLPEGPSLPHAVRLIPWIAQYLRPYSEEDVLPVVQQWLDGKPLAEHISTNPQDEDLKVRHLKSLLYAIDNAGKPTAGRIIP